MEARCEEKTMEEWLGMEEIGRGKHLVYDKVLGPDIFFYPLVYVQVILYLLKFSFSRDYIYARIWICILLKYGIKAIYLVLGICKFVPTRHKCNI